MQLRDQRREFERREVEIWVITTDARIEERGLHAILADRPATVSATYGVAFQVLDGANRPATFVVDREGIIRFEYRAGQKPGRVFVDDDQLFPDAHWSYDRPSMSQLLKVLDGVHGVPALDGVRKEKLARLAEASVPMLAAALKDEDSYVRAEAATLLAKKGPAAKDAVPALIAALGDKVGYVRSEVAKALGKIGPDARSAIPHLMGMFEDHDDGVRFGAALALRDLGPEAKTAVATLLKAAKEPKNHLTGVGEIAGEALKKIGPDAIPALIDALRDDPDLRFRWRIASMLGDFGPNAKSAVPALLVAVKDEYWGTRKQAILALGRIDPETDGFLLLLLEALKDDEVYAVRNAAAVTLGSLEKQKDIILPALGEALEDKDSYLRLAVAQAIWRLSPGNRRVVEVLIGLLKDEEPGIRNESAVTLKSIDPEAAKKAGVP